MGFFFFEIKVGEDFFKRFGTDTGAEVFFTIFVLRGVVFFLGKELFFLQGGHARFDHNEVFEIEHALKLLQCHIDDKADTGWQRFEEPDVGDGRGKVNVTHAFTTNAGEGNLYATFFANNPFVFHALILTAKTFVIFYRTEDTGTEETVFFGFESTIVDRFGLFNFTE